MRILFLLIPLLLPACDDTIKTNFVPTNTTSGGSSYCPTNFVRVPALSPYTSEDFCVSKYEMKILGQANGDQVYNSAFVGDSRADGTPWVSITRDNAISECSALGSNYELMTNGDWQTLARNIEGVSWNWSGGTVGAAGGLSRSVGMAGGVAAGDDSNSCVNTGNTCDLSTWNARRRVHRLSNGEYIWDVAGNAAEWVRDDSNFYDGLAEVSQLTNAGFKGFYGPAGNYVALNAEPYGGLGSAVNNNAVGTIARGGAWGAGANGGTYNAGIFGFTTQINTGTVDNSIGFRCAYRPQASTDTTQSLMPRYIIPYTQVTADGTALELGMRFTTTANGTITKIRFFRGNANPGGYTVSLWSNAGVLLGSGNGTDGTIPGWQEVSLATPVSVTAGSTYVASYYTSNGLYASHSGGFISAYQSLGVLSAGVGAGIYRVGAGFPNATFGNNNYYVDVVYAP